MVNIKHWQCPPPLTPLTSSAELLLLSAAGRGGVVAPWGRTNPVTGSGSSCPSSGELPPAGEGDGDRFLSASSNTCSRSSSTFSS